MCRNGKLSPVGDTVDVPNATWTNTIGAPELIADCVYAEAVIAFRSMKRDTSAHPNLRDATGIVERTGLVLF